MEGNKLDIKLARENFEEVATALGNQRVDRNNRRKLRIR